MIETKDLEEFICCCGQVFDHDEEDKKYRAEIRRRLRELDELKECSVLGVGGNWIRIKDIQLLADIAEEKK